MWIDVRANDTDVDHSTYPYLLLTPEIVSYPQNGVAYVVASQVSYTPNPHYNGPDSFEYIIKDEHGWYSTTTATVDITVTPRNDKPKANKGGAGLQLDEDAAPLAFSFNDDDEDPEVSQALTYALVVQPTKGTVDFVSMTYTPDPNASGSDYFEYTITDDDQAGPTANLTSDPAGVAVAIAPVNDAPTAEDASKTIDEDTVGTIDISAKYSDIDNAWSTLAVTVDSPYASFAGGVITYTPPQDYNGGDSFSYTVTDPGGAQAVANVSVTINPVNDAPDVYDKEHAVPAGTTFDLDAWDGVDVDGDWPFTTLAVTQPMYSN